MSRTASTEEQKPVLEMMLRRLEAIGASLASSSMGEKAESKETRTSSSVYGRDRSVRDEDRRKGRQRTTQVNWKSIPLIDGAKISLSISSS